MRTAQTIKLPALIQKNDKEQVLLTIESGLVVVKALDPVTGQWIILVSWPLP